MSNKTMMKIVVSAKSRYGVLDKTTEKWFNPTDSKLLKEFDVDATYDVEMEDNKGKDGKVYTNIVKIVKRYEAESKPAPAPANKVSQSGHVRDFDKENRGKVKSLFIEALLSNSNVVLTLNDIEKLNDPNVQASLNKLVESVF